MSRNSNRENPFISAFGIHMGGGYVLLKALINELDGAVSEIALDSRVRQDFQFPQNDVKVKFVRRSLFARALCVNRLATKASAGSTLLCFNSLPPLRKSPGRVIVYIQSALFDGTKSISRYSLLTSIRIAIERVWFRLGIRNVDEIWVQSRSMAEKLGARYPDIPVHVRPFVDDNLFERLSLTKEQPPRQVVANSTPSFFYPADGIDHKNHRNLIKAWKILAGTGNSAKLLLTLTDDEWRALTPVFRGAVPENVINIGRLSRDDVLKTMHGCTALIFPSLTESLGLPLIEARAINLPIIASEKEFVRDVCIPSESFDPHSPRSIAMAVERHITGASPMLDKCLSAKQLVNMLLDK